MYNTKKTVKKVSTFLLSILLLAIPVMSQAKNIHDPWNRLVSQNVVTINEGKSTQVNYKAMKAQESELTRYLNTLSAIKKSNFNDWNNAKQLAFLINAYNAFTVALIVKNLDNDDSSLNSIKDLGGFFSSPWRKEFIPLLGKTLSLDNIEHDLIRGAVNNIGKAKYNDPRIHFALNCASIGCPALREEAYTAGKLSKQLEQQTLRFLSDPTRHYALDNTLNISSIFKWYKDDFEKGYNNAYSLNAFLLQYAQALKLSTSKKNALEQGEMEIEFLKYDWGLNAHR